jgi:hypothetical protein
MPAESPAPTRTDIRSVYDQRRATERRACGLPVTVGTPAGDIRARLTDVSANGLAFRSDSLMMLRPGQKLRIGHPQFGEVSCIVRWATPPRYGVEITASGTALAHFMAFYDMLVPEPGDEP